MSKVQVTRQEVNGEVNIEMLKEKILAAIGYEIVYAFHTFAEEDSLRLQEALNADPHVAERVNTLMDTLNILEGNADSYPRW
ncbi:MAG: hypothetical protein ACPL5F_12160 [Moorellaceae bacterium]